MGLIDKFSNTKERPLKNPFVSISTDHFLRILGRGYGQSLVVFHLALVVWCGVALSH